MMPAATVTAAIAFPEIDPVLFSIGPLAIRWYALAYVCGLLLGWHYMRRINRRADIGLTSETIDDFLVWATVGVILGGRIGYVLFYNFSYYAHEPLQALMVWQGGMSFHGGLIGVVVAMVLYARKSRISLLSLADLTACAVPIGLFFGRLANFVNGELYGRATDVAWGVIFPTGGPVPRHPSQLYEALLEGAILFVLLWALSRRPDALSRPGLLTGVFLVGYSVARGISELFREPDVQIGFLTAGSTMGQWLSLPMLLGGLYLIWHARRGPGAASR
jgi:phosphatidylglycerol:prolipoprotein diacylglycerol transferase